MKIKCVKEIKEELILNKVYALLGNSILNKRSEE